MPCTCRSAGTRAIRSTSWRPIPGSATTGTPMVSRRGRRSGSAGETRVSVATRSGCAAATSTAIAPPIELPKRWTRSLSLGEQLLEKRRHDLDVRSDRVVAVGRWRRPPEAGQVGGPPLEVVERARP